MSDNPNSRIAGILCQIDAIGAGVSNPSADFDLGELRTVSTAMLMASQAIENEIRWRVSNRRASE